MVSNHKALCLLEPIGFVSARFWTWVKNMSLHTDQYQVIQLGEHLGVIATECCNFLSVIVINVIRFTVVPFMPLLVILTTF